MSSTGGSRGGTGGSSRPASPAAAVAAALLSPAQFQAHLDRTWPQSGARHMLQTGLGAWVRASLELF